MIGGKQSLKRPIIAFHYLFAKKQLTDRKMINKTLGYGFGATVFGYMMFILLVSPTWVKKIAYKVFR